MKSETTLQNKIRLALGRRANVRMFRNNVGLFKTKDGRNVQTGLCVGSSDLIGFQSITITPEMVGQKIAVFTAIEVKTEKGKVSPQQDKFIEMVGRFGGIGTVVRSVDEAMDVLKT
ncbi:MAG: VRR-NUC domain-containing protein [Methylococcales bacterium]|nr:VRR-NUC domain-containing protein [Methylococcales bacterium]